MLGIVKHRGFRLCRNPCLNLRQCSPRTPMPYGIINLQWLQWVNTKTLLTLIQNGQLIMTNRACLLDYTIHHLSSKQCALYVLNDNGKRCHPLSNKWISSDWYDTQAILLSVQQLVHANNTIFEIMKAVYWWPFDYLIGPLILRGISFQNIIMLQCSLVTDSEKIYDIEIGPNAK